MTGAMRTRRMTEMTQGTQRTEAADMLSTLRAVPGLRRAWPAKQDSAPASVSIECVDDQGYLRAGHITAGGTPDLLPYAYDPALPALSTQLNGELVVHRAGRRAVVMEASRVRKIVRPHKAACLVRAHTTAASVLRVTGLRMPRILGNGDDVVDLELLPGRSLDELGDAGLPGWQRLTEAWSRLGERGADLPVHGPRQEAEVLQYWLASAHRYGVIDQQNLLHEQVVDTCLSLREGSETHVITHRDLHDGQLLWDGTSLGVIDLDGARMAEPALDLMNLRAHAELHNLRGHLSAHSLDVVIGHIDDVASRMPTTRARLEAYLQASRLRLIFVHSFRPGASSWLGEWMDHALSAHSGTH